MREDTLAKQLNRSNINLLLSGIALIVISCIFLIVTARSNLNEVLGPVTMTPAEIVKIEDPSKLFRYYVCTTGSRVSGSIWQDGYQTLNREDNSVKETTINSEVQLLQLEDKMVLIRRKQASKDTSIAGALIPIPRDLYELTDKLRQEPVLKANLLPMMIDSTRFNWGGYFVLFIFTGMIICGIVFVRKAQTRISDKFQNPSIKQLARLGDARTLLPEIEDQMRMTDSVYRCSTLWLTKDWLITGKFAGMEIRNVKELAWVYPKTTTHSVNFIPTGKTHGLIICDSQGKYTEIPLPSSDFTTIIETIESHAPWAYYGFSEANKNRWNSKDRATLIAEVEERRREMEKEKS